MNSEDKTKVILTSIYLLSPLFIPKHHTICSCLKSTVFKGQASAPTILELVNASLTSTEMTHHSSSVKVFFKYNWIKF